jgi:hypothetical protein
MSGAFAARRFQRRSRSGRHGTTGPAQGRARPCGPRVADVHGLGAEAGGDADIQVGLPRPAARAGLERPDEAQFPAHHLQHQLGQVDARQHRRHPFAQLGQARWLGDRFQAGHVQASVPVDGDVAARSGKPVTHLSVGLVQGGGLAGQQIAGVLFGQFQRSQHRVLGLRPGRPVEQLGPGVGPAGGGRCVDATALEVAVELGEDAERVGVPVDPASRERWVAEHQARCRDAPADRPTRLHPGNVALRVRPHGRRRTALKRNLLPLEARRRPDELGNLRTGDVRRHRCQRVRRRRCRSRGRPGASRPASCVGVDRCCSRTRCKTRPGRGDRRQDARWWSRSPGSWPWSSTSSSTPTISGGAAAVLDAARTTETGLSCGADVVHAAERESLSPRNGVTCTSSVGLRGFEPPTLDPQSLFWQFPDLPFLA